LTIVVTLGTAGWIVNAAMDGSVLTWLVVAIWLVLATLLIRAAAGGPARHKRSHSRH
jgi:hypothetical protein